MIIIIPGAFREKMISFFVVSVRVVDILDILYSTPIINIYIVAHSSWVSGNSVNHR